MASNPGKQPLPQGPPNAASASTGSEPTDNPFAQGMTVSVSVPQTIKVRMVNADGLSDYEWLFFISSLLGGAVVGFLIASLQASDQQRLPYVSFTAVLFILFAMCVRWTLIKRHRLTASVEPLELIYGPVQPKKQRAPRRSSQRKKKEEPAAQEEAPGKGIESPDEEGPVSSDEEDPPGSAEGDVKES